MARLILNTAAASVQQPSVAAAAQAAEAEEARLQPAAPEAAAPDVPAPAAAAPPAARASPPPAAAPPPPACVADVAASLLAARSGDAGAMRRLAALRPSPDDVASYDTLPGSGPALLELHAAALRYATGLAPEALAGAGAPWDGARYAAAVLAPYLARRGGLAGSPRAGAARAAALL
jgi:hypothetical protein